MSVAEAAFEAEFGPTDRFIRGFFGEENIISPTPDPDSDAGRFLLPNLQTLRTRETSDVPVMLPRRREVGGALTMYVIARDTTQATVVGEMLTAFVGPSFSDFDGLPARLNATDPVEQAILEYVGAGLTFKVTMPVGPRGNPGWASLKLLQETLKFRPARSRRVRKPIGRLLADFELALAAGENSESADLLDQLSAAGGLSSVNLAHLRIKRLARLGRDAELLRLAGLEDVVLAGPPAPIKDAILAAIFATVLATPLEAGDLASAEDSLRDAGRLVPALLSGGLSGFGAEALAVTALTASIVGSTGLLTEVMGTPEFREQVARVAPLVEGRLASAVQSSATAPPPSAASLAPEVSGPKLSSLAEDTEANTVTTPGSWSELVQALAAGSADMAAILAGQAWADWVPPAEDDQAIADTLAGLDDQAADRAWSIAGPLVDADGYEYPAARTARQLINIALLYDHFSPGDLAGIIALTEIVLRSGPDVLAYRTLLDDLEGQSTRWAGPDRAPAALDLADLIARNACPDGDSQLRLAITLLRPLHAHARRLELDEARFAGRLSEELGIALDWPTADDVSGEDDESLAAIPSLEVLLYSLDEGVLERTKSLLVDIAPNVEVRLSHEKVGTMQLKQNARTADIIVMATRCAKHAATGFIRQHASDTAVVTEANGSGSASLLRAAVGALRTRVGR
jgi:hypothetical protein